VRAIALGPLGRQLDPGSLRIVEVDDLAQAKAAISSRR
jgi:hypothetical protein